jgi:hypothetical protein
VLLRSAFTGMFDVSFPSRYKSQSLVFGKAVRLRHCPATVFAEKLSNYATGESSGKAAQLRRSVSQETGQTLTRGVFDFDGRVGERSDD